MECWSVRQKISAYLDKAVSEEESKQLRRHLSDCDACTREAERFERVRAALRSLPNMSVPSELTLRLRVVASRVRAESARAESGWRGWRDRIELTVKNLMRPLALPLAGGICSAVVLFSALVPTFTSTYAKSNTPASTWDVPTMLATEPTVMCTAPVVFPEADAVVDVTIDPQGRMVNYKIVNVAPGQKIDQLRPLIENQLLFTAFRPATAFGKPISSTVRISFGSSHVEVRG
jgi:anti-sigma factor (TIGR02949 family)